MKLDFFSAKDLILDGDTSIYSMNPVNPFAFVVDISSGTLVGIISPRDFHRGMLTAIENGLEFLSKADVCNRHFTKLIVDMDINQADNFDKLLHAAEEKFEELPNFYYLPVVTPDNRPLGYILKNNDNSVESNFKAWQNDFDWTNEGEEWSEPYGSSKVQWIAFMHPRLLNIITNKSSILEIAPGYGR